MKAWALKKKNMKGVDTFEIWAYRRIIRISWKSRITNQEILREMVK